ncbi:cobalt-precorrin-6A reductase [Clostridium sp. D2Q-14]|uniref:cobalt-precorrin-6A reductase n=1 Tax=Anaeromonas gelatinilytica TaxID=2683194 RepID=UPI00193C4F4E|nr:cobalt-precorrin-6A reductase [Anaeromonas gelatinilytica]MBS4535482.1 cobalt-precorrin-6A reductase [Anaeromonas gelatinilytica]
MILVLGGTKDGRNIAKKLLDEDYEVIVTVTTEYGQEIMGNNEGIKVLKDRLDQVKLKELIINEDIKVIIDGTHPYAIEISKLAMEISKKMKIPYFRFEREAVVYKNVIEVEGFKEATEILKDTRGNIVLTTGSKNLDIFVENIEKNRIYARVLPTSEVIEKCEGLGINAGHIIGIQGPFSKELNKALFHKYSIKYMVTKESGDTGGTLEKIGGALELGIKVVLIKRPNIVYKNVFNNIDEIIKKIKEEL